MARLLLAWFGKNKRALPWRKTRDPYKIWISEIMLQQTQVGTVIPYYKRWIKNFPNIKSLAGAPLSRVLKLWEGLGYYSRARNLHKTAKGVAGKLGGRFPDSREELQKLPGIGRYTAGALASIAFGKPEPILDGNVKRVLSRVLALKKPIDRSGGEKILWETSKKLAEAALPRAGDLNQSLMELGALVCVPENPNCPACPVENACGARRLGLEEKFPVKSRKKRTEELRTIALVLWKGGRVLLEKQPLYARWGGLWAFPHWIHPNGKGEAGLVREKAREHWGIRLNGLKKRMEIRHGFTKYRVRLGVYESRVVIASPEGAKQSKLLRRPNGLLAMTRWYAPQKLANLPLPTPHQKIAGWVKNHA